MLCEPAPKWPANDFLVRHGRNAKTETFLLSDILKIETLTRVECETDVSILGESVFSENDSIRNFELFVFLCTRCREMVGNMKQFKQQTWQSEVLLRFTTHSCVLYIRHICTSIYGFSSKERSEMSRLNIMPTFVSF